MSDVTEGVRRVIEQDLILREALARGILRYSSTAVWLKKHHGIDGSAESIARTIQRYEPTSARRNGSVWDALEGASIHQKHPVSVIVTDRTKAVHESLSDLLDIVNLSNQESLRLIPSQRSFTLVVPRGVKDETRDVIGATRINEPIEDLYEVSIQLHPTATAGAEALGALISTLTSQGIEVPLATNGIDEHVLLVDEERHHDALITLMTAIGDATQTKDP